MDDVRLNADHVPFLQRKFAQVQVRAVCRPHSTAAHFVLAPRCRLRCHRLGVASRVSQLDETASSVPYVGYLLPKVPCYRFLGSPRKADPPHPSEPYFSLPPVAHLFLARIKPNSKAVASGSVTPPPSLSPP